MKLKNKWLKMAIPAISLGLLMGFGTVNLSYSKQMATQAEHKKEVGAYQSELKESYAKLDAIADGMQEPTVLDAIKSDKIMMYLSQPSASTEQKDTLYEEVEKMFNENNIDKEKLFKVHILLNYTSDSYKKEYESSFKEKYTYEEFIKIITIQQINNIYEAGSIGEKIVVNDNRLEGLNILLKLKEAPKVRDYLEKIVVPSGVYSIISVKTQEDFSPKDVLKMIDKELEDLFFVEDYEQEISSRISKEKILSVLEVLNDAYKKDSGKEYTDKELESFAENYALFYKTIIDKFSHEEQPIAIDVCLPPGEDKSMPRLACSVIQDKNGEYHIWIGCSATPYKEWKDFALKIAENVDNFYKK